MAVSHEEADVSITNQALPLAKQGSKAHVACDDTDVFALLIHFVHKDINPRILLLLAETGCNFGIGEIKAFKTFNPGCMLPNFENLKGDIQGLSAEATYSLPIVLALKHMHLCQMSVSMSEN